jgi:hypothetical protein
MLNDVWSVLVSPVRFFESLRERPRWLGAVIVLVAVTVIAFLLVADLVAEVGKTAALERAQDDQGRQAIEKFFENPMFKVILVAGPAAMHFVSVFLYGAIALLLLALTGGNLPPRPYGAAVRAGLWAKIVEVPHMILFVPLAKAAGSPEIYFGPAALMNGDMTDRLFRFAAGFDIFHIWYIVLFALGIRICLNVSTARALVAVLLPWIVRQLLRLAWA